MVKIYCFVTIFSSSMWDNFAMVADHIDPITIEWMEKNQGRVPMTLKEAQEIEDDDRPGFIRNMPYVPLPDEHKLEGTFNINVGDKDIKVVTIIDDFNSHGMF